MEISAFEAKKKLNALLDLVEQGEEVTITRHGRPVARLVPPVLAADRGQAEAAAERIRARARVLELNIPTDELLTYRDEGRR